MIPTIAIIVIVGIAVAILVWRSRARTRPLPPTGGTQGESVGDDVHPGPPDPGGNLGSHQRPETLLERKPKPKEPPESHEQ